MGRVVERLIVALEEIVAQEVAAQVSQSGRQQGNAEAALADLFVRFDPPCTFIKGPFRMAHDHLVLPGNPALAAAEERMRRGIQPITLIEG
jgi:hypothetical protein